MSDTLDRLARRVVALGPDAARVLLARLDPVTRAALSEAMRPSRLSAIAGRPLHPLASKPDVWVTTKLREHLTEGQQEIARSVHRHRYTAAKAAHDVGKSFDAARIAAHWLDSRPAGEALVVTTAPTYQQVRTILWLEIARAHRAGKLKGRITETEWKINLGPGPDEVVGIGRKPADYDPAAFQGLHRRYVLVIIDEAGGVPKTIFDAVDTLVTNEESRVLAIGNPDDPSSQFAEVCKPGSGWHVITLDGLRSPNFTADAVAKHPELLAYMIREGIAPSTEPIPDTIRSMLLSPQWVAERIRRWGVDSPMFQSKVRGQFPKVTTNTVIDPHWIELAKARELTAPIVPFQWGVDVARFGTDRSTVYSRRGGVIRFEHEIAYGPTTELSGWIIAHGLEHVPQPVAMVDAVGVGGGVADELRDSGYPTVDMVASARATEVMPNGVPRFTDARSEWWWRARRSFAGPSGTGTDGYVDLDPDDLDLHAQLIAPRFRYTAKGQISVESKDEMKARGIDSPDRADAVVMALQPIPEDWVPMGLPHTSDFARDDVW